VLLGQFTGNADNLSVATQAIYITTDIGYVARVRKDGSDVKPFAMPAFTSTAFQGSPVAEDGDRAFFVWNGNPLRLAYCTISSCDSTITPIGGPYSQYFALDATDHKIAWIDYTPSQLWAASSTGTVTGSPVPGGNLPDGSTGSSILYAQGGIYFSSGTSIQRLPLSGGSQTTVGYTSTTSSTSLRALATNSAQLFFGQGSAIFSTPLPSGSGAPGSKVIDASPFFAADDSSAYWISDGIETCDLGSCGTTQKLIPGHPDAHVEEIGVDGSALYWAESAVIPAQNIDAFSVWKLAK
jgi:hypothetical protein